MATDPYLATKYRDAWIRLIAPGWKGDFPFVSMGTAAITRPIERPNGIELSKDPLARDISRLLDNNGAAILRDFPAAGGVGLSLRYRDGQVDPMQPCLTFFVRELEEAERIPHELAGVPTDVVEGGVPELQSNGHQSGLRLRPALPGCSVSHHRVKSGTLGCVVKDDLGVIYALSCAHVLSDGRAVLGDAIVQAGTRHGGSAPADQIAAFTRAMPLNTNPCIADAAIAAISRPWDVNSAIRYVGARPAGTRTLTNVGVFVQKSGDETGLTHGVVAAYNATIGPYTANGVRGIYFTNCIVTTGMSLPGDSGSILLDYQLEALGLLFGGLQAPGPDGRPTSSMSWFSPIDPILKHFGVSLA